MYRNKPVSTLLTPLFCLGFMVTSPSVTASEGERQFQQHCSRCHQSPRQLETPADQIFNMLKSGSIRLHRFELDDETIRHIVAYISEQQP